MKIKWIEFLKYGKDASNNNNIDVLVGKVDDVILRGTVNRPQNFLEEMNQKKNEFYQTWCSNDNCEKINKREAIKA